MASSLSSPAPPAPSSSTTSASSSSSSSPEWRLNVRELARSWRAHREHTAADCGYLARELTRFVLVGAPRLPLARLGRRAVDAPALEALLALAADAVAPCEGEVA